MAETRRCRATLSRSVYMQACKGAMARCPGSGKVQEQYPKCRLFVSPRRSNIDVHHNGFMFFLHMKSDADTYKDTFTFTLTCACASASASASASVFVCCVLLCCVVLCCVVVVCCCGVVVVLLWCCCICCICCCCCCCVLLCSVVSLTCKLFDRLGGRGVSHS